MARIPRELGLTAEELDELMMTSWNMRIATVGPGERINLTPLWFGWAGGRIYFYGRGQKIANLRRNPVCTVLVDRKERFPELEGAMFHGRATVLENADDEAADPHLEEVRRQMGTKYAGGHGEPATDEPVRYALTAAGRSARWVVVDSDRLITWDNHKLPNR
ncbi:MAG TPA: pyridoxamine 5'-phosphate oxidase family protein [Mycobacterium sp.]|jgi:nitroimidazol reductase NimA-like FMN-containing flavoprotein (pyridoxamine 5'-phosphate oxidase superfamily)